METVSIKGKTYVKASQIARELGYTNDYVGQLCRSGKVSAELVGRSWYVMPDSIHSHKKSRYRSTAKKTKSSLKQDQVSAIDSPGVRRLSIANTDYAQDDAELFPQVAAKEPVVKKHTVAIDTPKKTALKVKKTGVKYHISTTQPVQRRFQGRLQIADFSDQELPAEDLPELIPMNQEVEQVPVLKNEYPKNGSIAVVLVRTMTVIVPTAIALALATAVTGFQYQTVASATTQESTYSFNLAGVRDSLE